MGGNWGERNQTKEIANIYERKENWNTEEREKRGKHFFCPFMLIFLNFHSTLNIFSFVIFAFFDA